MPRFLISLHHPNDYDPSTEDAAMAQAIDELNEEMVKAGIRVYVGGLHHPSQSRHLTKMDGEVEIAEGPYLATKEHVAGFWVIIADSMEEALGWARKAVVACKASVEIRPFI